jgi:hypothetical protein
LGYLVGCVFDQGTLVFCIIMPEVALKAAIADLWWMQE